MKFCFHLHHRLLWRWMTGGDWRGRRNRRRLRALHAASRQTLAVTRLWDRNWWRDCSWNSKKGQSLVEFYHYLQGLDYIMGTLGSCLSGRPYDPDDVWLRGRRSWRLHDVTQVTSAARPFHVILHISWLDNFCNRDHFYISEVWYTMLMLRMC